jgi:hypothetical protein
MALEARRRQQRACALFALALVSASKQGLERTDSPAVCASVSVLLHPSLRTIPAAAALPSQWTCPAAPAFPLPRERVGQLAIVALQLLHLEPKRQNDVNEKATDAAFCFPACFLHACCCFLLLLLLQ